MADPLLPQDIARHTFEVSRRGYEQQEVRGFLHEVAALVERLTRAETELRERAERAEARLGKTEHPDEAVMLEVLGEETTRVLTSAREAATEIRAKAETAAERVIAEATAAAADARSAAGREVDALLADARSQSETVLEAARTELARRSAEAEEAAARIRAEGQEQAEALREEGRAGLAAARADAESALDAARQQGRHMVAEAQAVRERVLRDLSVRRKRARQQVEKLNAGRERLLQAYDVVRHTIDEATTELNVSLIDARVAGNAAARRIDDEPETTLEELDAEVADAGLADLPLAEIYEDHDAHDDGHDDDEGSGPLSGEVPVIMGTAPAIEPEAPASATNADGLPWPVADERRGRRGRRKKGFEGLPAGELTVVAPPSPDEGVRLLTEVVAPHEAVAAEDDAAGEPGPAGSSAPESIEPSPVDPSPADSPVVADVSLEEVATRVEQADTPVDATDLEEAAGSGESASSDDQGSDEAAEEPVDVGVTDAAAVESDAESSGADDVFARLRAERGAGPADTPGEPDPTAITFAARAEAVAPIEKDLSRRLKRAMADEQNEVLDLLRRAKPKGVDDLLPDADQHAGRWADAVAATLGGAAEAGAATHGGAASPTADLADELARALTAPLRERIDRSFSASDGNLEDIADRVRALYREWKGPRLTETTQHFVAAAYARGVFDGVEAGTPVRWVLDPSVAACPDCDDNVLAGAIAKGDEFPTGHPCAPAHPGCHCLVLAAE